MCELSSPDRPRNLILKQKIDAYTGRAPTAASAAAAEPWPWNQHRDQTYPRHLLQHVNSTWPVKAPQDNTTTSSVDCDVTSLPGCLSCEQQDGSARCTSCAGNLLVFTKLGTCGKPPCSRRAATSGMERECTRMFGILQRAVKVAKSHAGTPCSSRNCAHHCELHTPVHAGSQPHLVSRVIPDRLRCCEFVIQNPYWTVHWVQQWTKPQ